MAGYYLQIFLVIVFLFCSAFFSASEIALFSIPRERLLFFENNSKRSYRTVYLLLQDGQRTLLLLLLGNTFVNITLAGIINSLLDSVLPQNSPLLTLAVATLIIVVFGEMLPKNIALRRNETIAIHIAPTLYLFKTICTPVLKVIQKLNHFFLIRFKQRMRQPNPFITIEELKTGVIHAAQQHVISPLEQDIIIGVLSEGALPVRRLMTHRSSLVILTENNLVGSAVARLTEAKQNFGLVRAKGFSGQILGTVTLGILLGADPYSAVKKEISAPLWVPETMAIADLMSFLLQEEKTEACVLDEFGSFSGVFSLTTGLNKILQNAFPKDELKSRKNILGNTMVFSGLQDSESIEDWLPAQLKPLTKDARTLNGVLTRFLGRIPKTGDRFAINGWNFYIIEANPTRIESVLIRKGNDGDS